MGHNKAQEIIDYAVQNEIEAYNFYKLAADRVQDKSLQNIFAELAEEEQKHKVFLEEFLKSGENQIMIEQFSDYKNAETVDKPKFTDNMSFVDAVALAMKNEEEAMELYQNLANSCAAPEQKKLFLGLAEMEQLHKTRLEEIYTNAAYVEDW